MAVQQVIDITADLNDNTICQLDIGGWDFAVVQLATVVGTWSFFTTIDSGDITGVSDGSATSATNFIAVQGTNLATGSGVTSLATAGLVKFSGIGRFLKISGGTSVSKGLVRLYKIC